MTAADLARVTRPAVQLTADMAALVLERRALAKRQARAERLERKRVEHLRGHMPLDDPDRHDIDRVDTYFATAASSFPTSATDADYPGWSDRLAALIEKNQQPGGTA